MSTNESATDADAGHTSGNDRIIVVSSQPTARDQDLPPQRLRSLGAVASHATEPVSSERTARTSRSGRGNALVAILTTALPLAAAAWGITFLTGRIAVLTATGVLALLWLIGLGAAWRALGPGNRSSRGGVWLGRAVGLVVGGFAAFYVLVDTVTPLV